MMIINSTFIFLSYVHSLLIYTHTHTNIIYIHTQTPLNTRTRNLKNSRRFSYPFNFIICERFCDLILNTIYEIVPRSFCRLKNKKKFEKNVNSEIKDEQRRNSVLYFLGLIVQGKMNTNKQFAKLAILLSGYVYIGSKNFIILVTFPTFTTEL